MNLPALLLMLSITPQTPTSPPALLKQLVEVLNTLDEGKLKEFVSAWTPSAETTKLRVERWGDLAKRYSPFKFEAAGPESDSEVDAFVMDKSGSRLVFRLFINPRPTLTISGLLVRPAYAVEGVPAEYAHWSSLDDLARRIAEADKSPGMGIAVIHVGKLKVGVSGIRSVGATDPAEADDVWAIGSIGKSICATVIASLIERGKLRWNETVGEALADLPMDPGYKAVTLEQLMHQRGGAPADSNFNDEQIERIVGDKKTPTEIRERYALDILGRPPVGAPGERYVYSNAGYALLSVIAERKMGVPYEQLLHELIFKPLNLHHSFTDADPLPAARPHGHMMEDGMFVTHDMAGQIQPMLLGAGAGLYMSVGDLAQYGAAHLKGLRGEKGLLQPSTIKRLHEGTEETLNGPRYACGWIAESLPGLQPFDTHNGSDGTMRSQIAIFPDADLVVVGIANKGGESEPSPGFSAVMAVAQRYAAKSAAR